MTEKKKTDTKKDSKFLKPSVSNFLVVLLIVIAFFAGSQWYKVQKLENGQTGDSGKAANTQPSEPSVGDAPAVTSEDHIRGSENAEVTLIEYSDLECPFCKKFHSTVQKILQEYDGKVRFVYRHYPLPFHKNAQLEAEATECVAELGGNDKFWTYVDKIFEKTSSTGTSFDANSLAQLATETGVDGSAVKSCLDSGKYTQRVKDQMDGGTKAGVSGTPGTFVTAKKGGKDYISGALPYEEVKQKIDALLK